MSCRCTIDEAYTLHCCVCPGGVHQIHCGPRIDPSYICICCAHSFAYCIWHINIRTHVSLHVYIYIYIYIWIHTSYTYTTILLRIQVPECKNSNKLLDWIRYLSILHMSIHTKYDQGNPIERKNARKNSDIQNNNDQMKSHLLCRRKRQVMALGMRARTKPLPALLLRLSLSLSLSLFPSLLLFVLLLVCLSTYLYTFYMCVSIESISTCEWQRYYHAGKMLCRHSVCTEFCMYHWYHLHVFPFFYRSKVAWCAASRRWHIEINHLSWKHLLKETLHCRETVAHWWQWKHMTPDALNDPTTAEPVNGPTHCRPISLLAGSGMIAKTTPATLTRIVDVMFPTTPKREDRPIDVFRVPVIGVFRLQWWWWRWWWQWWWRNGVVDFFTGLLVNDILSVHSIGLLLHILLVSLVRLFIRSQWCQWCWVNRRLLSDLFDIGLIGPNPLQLICFFLFFL